MGATISDTLRQSKELNPRLPRLRLSFCPLLNPAWLQPAPRRSTDSWITPNCIAQWIYCSTRNLCPTYNPPHFCLPEESKVLMYGTPLLLCVCTPLCFWNISTIFPELEVQFPFTFSWERSVNQGKSRPFILRVRILHCHANNAICRVDEIARVCLKVRRKFDGSGEWAGECSKVP